MLNAWKSIAVFLDDADKEDEVLSYAARLARQYDAHLIGIYSINSLADEDTFSGFARGGPAIRSVVERRRTAGEEAASAMGARLAAIAQKHSISVEFRVLWNSEDTANAAKHSLHCDLVVVAAPERQSGLPESASAERILFETGVPVLIVPEGWAASEPVKKVLVAWNASKESRRAVADAMPFIASAAEVTLVVVDAEARTGNHGENPGADAALALARHGAKVNVEQIDSEGRSVQEVLLARATALHCDLVVIGAYSRARTAQLIFGGVTRSLLATSTVPLFVSR